MKSFSHLFKLYRLQSGFATLSEISDELATKGYNYDPSLYSHWQQGTRIPTNRKFILAVIAIFTERGVIKTLYSANEFLATTGLGYLTKEETENIFKRPR